MSGIFNVIAAVIKPKIVQIVFIQCHSAAAFIGGCKAAIIFQVIKFGKGHVEKLLLTEVSA